MIRLRYASRCNSCNQYLTKGTEAYWRRGSKSVRCKVCAEDPETFTISYVGPVPADRVRKALTVNRPKGTFNRR